VWDKALDHARRAGERAQALHAPRAVIEHFTRALHAAARQAITPPLQLYRGRAQAYETLGEFDRARSDHEAALALARAAGDRHAEWQALLELGLLWASHDYARTGEYYRSALELAQAMDNPAALGRSLNRLANWHVNVEQPLVGQRHHTEALAIFEGLGDQRGIAETLDLLGMASCCSGDLRRSMAIYERAVALFRELDDRKGLVMSLALLASRAGDYHFDPLASAGHDDRAELARAVAAGEAARATAHEIEWRAGEAFACCQLGQCLGTWGEYRQALAMLEAGCRIAAEIEHRQWLAFAHELLGRLYLDLLALPAARHHLELAISLAGDVGSSIWRNAASGALIATCVQQGDLERAEAVLAAVPDLAGAPQSTWQRLLACARVELALARREPERALQLADEVCASLEIVDGKGERRVGPPHLGRLRGQALGALGQVAEAEYALQNDLAAAGARGCRPPLWRLHLALGQLYRADRRPAEAERELAAARSVIEELAANVPEQAVGPLDGISLHDQFLRSAIGRLSATVAPVPVRAAKQATDRLTPREAEVLRLLAAGRSNREIAIELVISLRTVEHHIASIYGKIGARRRADAVTYALRHDLLPLKSDR
jgi:DNA-binding CsgD family transcriptional regulator